MGSFVVSRRAFLVGGTGVGLAAIARATAGAPAGVRDDLYPLFRNNFENPSWAALPIDVPFGKKAVAKISGMQPPEWRRHGWPELDVSFYNTCKKRIALLNNYGDVAGEGWTPPGKPAPMVEWSSPINTCAESKQYWVCAHVKHPPRVPSGDWWDLGQDGLEQLPTGGTVVYYTARFYIEERFDAPWHEIFPIRIEVSLIS